MTITRCVQCALPVEGEKGEALLLFDLKGNIVTDAKPSSDAGLVEISAGGRILVRRYATSLSRIDPIDGHQLWRTIAEELESIDDTIVTEAAIFVYEGLAPKVQAIGFDGEVIDT